MPGQNGLAHLPGTYVPPVLVRVPAAYSHPAGHTRQCDQINQRRGLQEAERNGANVDGYGT